MTTPAVSIVIPTFNRALLVGKAIESVLAQTYQDFEVIVVDDGSTDNTAEELARFGDRICLIQQTNKGVSAARNTGIRAARGKWIAFLDSDDQWIPSKLDRQLDCLRQVETGMCFTRCISGAGEIIQDIDNLTPIHKQPGVYYFENPHGLLWQKKWHPWIQSLIIEKSLLEKVGCFDESLHAAEDTRLIHRLALISGFAYIDEPLVIISRDLTGSLTYDAKPESARKRLSSYMLVQSEAYWRMMEIDPQKASWPRNVLGYFISRRAEVACAENQLQLARAYAKDGLFLAGDIRTFLRCLGIYISPALFRTRFRRKWGGQANQN